MRTRSWRCTTWLVGVTLPFIVAFGGGAVAQCERQVEQTLRDLAVPQEDVQSVQITRRQFVDEPRPRFDYAAWVRLRSCQSGYLVIHMTDYCHVRQSYTDGDCEVSGVPQY